MGTIDANSTVTLRMRAGKVNVDEVDGDSKLLVWTKDFALKNFADGGGTSLHITLNREGHLSFGERAVPASLSSRSSTAAIRI